MPRIASEKNAAITLLGVGRDSPTGTFHPLCRYGTSTAKVYACELAVSLNAQYFIEVVLEQL